MTVGLCHTLYAHEKVRGVYTHILDNFCFIKQNRSWDMGQNAELQHYLTDNLLYVN